MACVGDLLQRSRALTAVSDSARLDTELLLAHALGQPRSYCYAHPEAAVDAAALQRFEALFARRAAGEPVAYLLGEREFRGLRLRVTPAVLVPRPETELLVDVALQRLPAGAAVLDLGTGSGAIALAIAQARPDVAVTAVDASAAALAVAQANAATLGLSRVRFACSDWFAALSGERFHVVVANPPYLAGDDPHLAQGDLRAEPRSALVAAGDGLADLYAIARAAPAHLHAGGWLLLEHGATQAAAVAACLRELGYDGVQTLPDLAGQDRLTLGCWHADAH